MILDAQDLILKKVESSAAGAAAIRDTLGGAFKQLTNNIHESLEEMKDSDGPLRRFVEGSRSCSGRARRQSRRRRTESISSGSISGTRP